MNGNNRVGSRSLPWPWTVTVATLVVVVTSLRFWSLQSRGLVALNPAKPFLALAQPIGVWALSAAFARDWRGLRRWRGHAWVIAALLLIFAAAISVLYPHFNRLELRALHLDSDIDDEFIVSAGNALRFRNPYADSLYTGNPISEGPGWVILNAVFGSPKRFFLLAPVHAAIFCAVLWRATGTAAASTLALLICLASTGLWESSFGGDLAAAGFAMASATVLCFVSRDRPAVVGLLAVLVGAIATVRLPFVLYPALVALLLWRAQSPRSAVVVASVGTAVALGLHVIFWAIQTDAYPPFHLVGQSLGLLKPGGLAVAAGLSAIVGLAVRRLWLTDSADVLFWQGLALFVPFAVVAWGSIASVGLTGDDWTRYLAPSIPSFAAAAAISACRGGKRVA